MLAPNLTLAQAQVEITGVSDSELEKNIRLLLSEIEAPLGRVNEDKFKDALIQQTHKALQAFAYYDAELEIEDLTFLRKNPEGVNNNEPRVSFSLRVNLGSKALVERVVLVNDLAQIDQTAMPNQLKQLVAQVKQLSGKPIDHAQYENLKNRLKTFTLLYGYFDFSFPLHKLIVQPGQSSVRDFEQRGEAKKPTTAIIHWIFYFGQRYRFGDVTFLNDTRGQEIALNVRPFKNGEYFDQSLVADYSIDMQSTNYFSSAIARASASTAEEFKVPIEVILEPKPKDTYEFGVGVSTDTGPRFTVDWTRPWVNLRGHSLGARMYLSAPRKSVELNYRIPMANPLNDFVNIQAGYRQIDDNQTQSDTVSLAIQRQWGAVEDDEWDKIGFLRFEQESFIQGLAEKETTRLLLPGFTYSRTRKDGDIFVTWGDLQQITIEGGSKSLLSDIDFSKVLARTKWIRELGKHRLIVRADAGAIATNNFDRVPSTQRFFAGGDQSIRGFGLNEVSDFDIVEQNGEDDIIDLKGGKYLAVASVEYAYPVAEKFRAAAFIDAGNASDKPFSNVAYGYGLGMHWLSPIGTVRVYAARGVSDFESTFRIHLVIGPGL